MVKVWVRLSAFRMAARPSGLLRRGSPPHPSRKTYHEEDADSATPDGGHPAALLGGPPLPGWALHEGCRGQEFDSTFDPYRRRNGFSHHGVLFRSIVKPDPAQGRQGMTR